MQVLHERCGGLDVHKEIVVACARVASAGRAERHVETFDTTTPGLLRLAEWLESHGCTHVMMEATGVYWRPVWHVLEGRFELLLANAAHVRNVPGRKTDVNDAMWLADLLAHGLVRASFVPPTPIQALRDLTRTRKQLVRQITQHTLRIQKTLEDANLKIAGVVSDILGASGRAILRGLIEGQTDPEVLLDRTTGRLRAPRARLLAGLTGLTTEHQRFLLDLHLGQVDALERAVRAVDLKIEGLIKPFRDREELLETMPGVSSVIACTILAEVGIEMDRFPTPGHLVSWAGLCPRMDQSAGRARSTRTRPGAPWLKTALVQAAWAAVRTKESYLRAQFLRLRARRGPKKAVVAVAASMLTAAYFILRDRVAYRDLGGAHFDSRDRDKAVRRLARRIEALGFKVEIAAAA